MNGEFEAHDAGGDAAQSEDGHGITMWQQPKDKYDLDLGQDDYGSFGFMKDTRIAVSNVEAFCPCWRAAA